MDQAQDFKKLGLEPEHVLAKEDGRRDTSASGHSEVWYFDGLFEDGHKIVVGFRPGDPYNLSGTVDRPNFNVLITKPDGETLQDFVYTDGQVNRMGSEHLDVHFGESYAVGDWQNFDLHVVASKGFRLDLSYHAVVEPFRQGTGIIALGDQEENYYTDLSVPNCQITGTLTYGEQTHAVTGRGYHDHQWMNITPYAAWHHWLWGHMYTENYTVYLYDFVSSAAYGYQRVPMFGIQDNRTGKTIFTTDGSLSLATTLTPQATTGREFPKTSHYHFTTGDLTADFELTWQNEIEVRDMYAQSPAAGRAQFDAQHLHPIYVRYYSLGSIQLTRGSQVQLAEKGQLIYEYNYLGMPDERAGV
ncbi:lipocalin-like domain-containing protein [Lactiplantibacillus carotarum]|uniref:lipocalin-like domain-containing protein n=1 Tax=Lactiplantibacillus carotarum TaxID=2993456 RepID=UPI00298ED32F|nr:lipocalin-like domain-containing protein [Lactiplantibacillus carotarum]